MLENVALDGLSSPQLAQRDIRGAFASSIRRTVLLEDVPMAAAAGIEFADAYSMTGECALAAGELALAERFAERVRTLPAHARQPHLAVGRTMTVAFLVGDWGRATALAPSFLEGWIRAGRPRAGNLTIGSQSAAAAFAMQGDDAESDRWRGLLESIRSPYLQLGDYLSVLYQYAVVAVHRGDLGGAEPLLATHPDEIATWQNGMWRPWYAALWAEHAVLAGNGEAADRLREARTHVAENPVAAALLDRADILHGGAGDLAAVAERLDRLGARYQAARTRVLAGGPSAARGLGELAALGTA